jgi:hypothetical protein
MMRQLSLLLMPLLNKISFPRWVILTIGMSTLLIGGCDNAEQTPSLAPDCIGIHCGADGQRYTGEGLGAWSYTNKSSHAVSLAINLSGLSHNQVTLVFSNLSHQMQNMPVGLTARGSTSAPLPPLPPQIQNLLPTDESLSLQVPLETTVWKIPRIGQNADIASVTNSPATLRSQTSINGFTYKLWVVDTEWISHAQRLTASMSSLLFGTPTYPGLLPQYLAFFPLAPWGNYPLTAENQQVISPASRTVNIVIAPTGGDFFRSDDLYQSASSNESVMFFLNSDGYRCAEEAQWQCFDIEDGMAPFLLPNVALHELTHLIHYYQRPILLGENQQFDKWLREAIASSQGDSVAISRFPNIPPFLQILTPWVSGAYACPLVSNQGQPGTEVHSGPCSQNYYKSGPAFISFLVHQYGTEIYQEFVKAKGSGIDVLDTAIRARGGLGFEEAFRRWGAMLALPKSDQLPNGYGYPATSIGNYFIPALKAENYAYFRKAPTVLPPQIEPYSHLFLVDHDQSNQYQREIQVPPGVALSVYIQ